jgi:hypothetical protein
MLLWLFVVLDVAWLLKAVVHPAPATAWPEVLAGAGVGPVSGGIVVAGVLVYTAAVLALAFATAGLRATRGEVLADLPRVPLIRRIRNR